MQSTEDPEARKADLVAKRGYIKASLTKLIKSLQESTSELSRQNLLVKQERLTSLFSKYEELCMEILDEDGDEYEEAYMRALVMLRELTVQPSAAPAGAVATARDTPASTSSKNDKRALALENAEPAARAPMQQRLEPTHRFEQQRFEQQNKKKTAHPSASNIAASTTSCLFCKCEHKLFSCPKFKLLPADERIAFAANNNLCNICLNKHNQKCRYHFKCIICKGKHNTMLHAETAEPPVTMMSKVSSTQVLLPTVRVKLVTNNGTEVLVKALLDSGSQTSFATAELVRLLDLKPKTVNTGIIGIGNAHSTMNKCVQLEVHSLVSQYKLPITCYVLDQITSKLPQQRFSRENISMPTNIKLADADFDVPSNIHILMAADVFFQVLLPQAEGASPQPAAASSHQPAQQSAEQPAHANNHKLCFLNTRFGYVIAGTLPNQCHSQQNNQITLFCRQCDSDINDTVSKFWKTESVPEIFPEKSSEFDQSEQIFQESVILKDKKFQVALPLKVQLSQVNETIGDSFNQALQRFLNLEKRFKKEPQLFEQYKEFIHQYVALGHGSVINIDKYDLTKDPVFFLPHHAVIRLDKKTTKCRVVFDASMHTRLRRSLNDILLNGSVTQKELLDILLQFRIGSYVFSTDLKNMFRSINLDPKFRSLQLILWRDTPDESIKCIELNTVTYGMRCSTFLATRCLIELANRYQVEFPAAATILRNQSYCDDILVSSNSLESLYDMKNQLIKILELGGVSYNTKTDTINITSPSSTDSVPKTKREILSHIAKFYDPLGLVGPIIVSAKLIIQRLWSTKMGWDSCLNDELKGLWFEFYKSLAVMKPIQIQRNVVTDTELTKSVQLVGFADAASSAAYGCCVYLRVVDKTGTVKQSLLCSKSRVNPLHQKLTVPRLELNAALLLAKLVAKVHSTMSLKLNINDVILFSDSQIVLAWLRTDITKLNIYVANRVKVVLQHTEQFSWSYVNTSDNPADCLSRGVQPHELEEHPLWWTGPSFLLDSSYQLPRGNEFDVPTDLPELKAGCDGSEFSGATVCSGFQANSSLCLDFLDKYSDINKMQRVLAYVLRFCSNLKSNKNKANFLLTEELNNALLLIVKHEQQKYFDAEIKLLTQNKPLKGSLTNVNPFVDDKGLIRVGGRLDCATIPYSQKHPVVLPNQSRVTKLIINNEHIRNLHAGPKITLSSINQKFWIINGLSEVKKTTFKCLTCFRLKAKVAEQLMGSLPHDRVNACRVFQKVGVDFAGPISVKQSRVRRAVVSKAYICVFVCFATKAVHLELTSDLTTPAFLAALKRFSARRGLPSDIYSDNASTFKGARNQLAEIYKLFGSHEHQQQVQAYAAQQGIRFHFIPSYSPVFAGLWEACVKHTKYYLKRVMLKALLTYEELCTVLAQVEAVINSRPLTPMSTDINDYTYLTPGHFLIGTALNAYPEKDVTDVPINRLKFWNICCNMYQQFWKVWHKTYLNMLQTRPKWKTAKPNVKIGALVILIENDSKPLHWPMARVTNVFPGIDGKVRAVEVSLPNGKSHRRSVTKICLLPIDTE
ncbi:uncharacterized protein [Choristoneura fumiferana]|uniref:uncharacterized protein n=1 Tax=Choristoneura fumiferana TaxID=7141 RepID=UPI003D159ABC